MKNKKAVKKAIITLFPIILVVVSLYCLIYILRTGKQSITVNTVSNFYSGSSINALIEVKNADTSESMKSHLKIQLLDSDNKKIKDVNESINIDEGETASISLDLPDDMDTGNYTLRVISNSGIYKDKIDVDINIIKDKESNIVISLDKGIYKPGDEINFRALLVSKKESTPLETNSVKVYIYDGNNNKVYSNEAKTSEYGIISGTFTLADEVNSGTYRIVVSTESQEIAKEFIVNPYVTPKFEAEITTDKENYTVGENANITFSAKYFFGEAVENASIIGTINGEEFVGITAEDGTFTKTVQLSDSGSILVEAQIEDSSNYFVEASKTIYCATDLYEIEVLPEYSSLVKGLDNDIYIITKTIDNKPVKTYSTITIGTITREVITDENGVGKFTLTSSDLSNFTTSSSKTLKIISQNMDGNRVAKNVELDVIANTGTIIKTDKIKYDEDEDISISLISSIELQNKVAYIFKGNDLIKTVSFDSDSVTLNLEGISGLVDIYINNNSNNSNIKYNYLRISRISTFFGNGNTSVKYSKKTIFIKPSKELNIDIQTDKETYSPRDTLNVSFSTTNENSEIVDSALLVSILDEAVLSLAENDLSIDNLKLALSDIELSDGVTASDLYACILNDSNETLLNSMLLKQYDENSNSLIQASNSNADKEIPTIVMIISAFILVIIVLLHFTKKYKKVRELIIAFIEIFCIFIIISVYFTDLFEDIFFSFNSYELITVLTCAVISIILYNLILYKQKDYLFNLIIEIGIVPGIIVGTYMLLVEIFDLENFAAILLFILLVIIAIISMISRKKTDSKVLKIISKIILKLIKAGVFWIATYLVCSLFDSVIGFIIVLVAYILYEKYILRKTNTKMEDGKIILSITGNELVGIIFGIIFIVIVVIGYIYSYTRPVIDSMSTTIYDEDSTYDSIDFNKIFDTSSGAVVAKSTQNNSKENITETETKNEIEIQKETKVEENVRNIFLESLAFIPELITEDGKANLDLTLSDNITTWNIQVIGNTKEGNVGFSNTNFKVFKEFFVDFTLPTNAVETDNISIPVTLYNYTENDLSINVDVKTNEWSNIGDYEKNVNVPANSTQNIYVPIEILKSGENTLRVETKANDVSDIVEKTMTVGINGFEEEVVVSSGSMEQNISQDILYKEDAISGTKKIKVKLYSSSISQIIEGMENILKMPTGCFEQTSSSLYPDILVLKYLEENDLSNEEIKTKALNYITSGYQKLLTYEVNGTKGGYSLYGNNPAETVITAFGLMEMNDLSEVYDVDENIITNMQDYIFSNQKSNGSFEYSSTYIGGTSKTDELAMNAYIIWALSEACPDDSRLEKSIEYLENKMDSVTDTYTLALIANAFSNTDNSNVEKAIEKLLDQVVMVDNETAYLKSSIRDYYGSYGRTQNIQATALASMVLTKEESNSETNAAFINYIISEKDQNGTWYNTQSTILSLKAINDFNSNSDISNQTIKVTFNGEERDIEINKNSLDVYELEFTNVQDENKIEINMEKGKIQYEIIKEYYEEYSIAESDFEAKTTGKIDITQDITQTVENVNDIINQKITVTNLSGDSVSNLIVRINIPQGCSVVEDSLSMLKYNNKIEKYEYNYGTINLYLRKVENNKAIDLDIEYRASFPETITGASIRAYDYYNPEIEGICSPVQIKVNN